MAITTEEIKNSIDNYQQLQIIKDSLIEGKDFEGFGILIEYLLARSSVRLLGNNQIISPSIDNTPYAVLPFELNSEIVPNGISHVVARPQRGIFQPRRLIITPKYAYSFNIIQIRVGVQSQVAEGIGGIPGVLFLPGLFGMYNNFTAALTAMDVTLTVLNISDKPMRFEASMLGDSL